MTAGAPSVRRPPMGRRAWLVLLVSVVLVAHLALVAWLQQQLASFQAGAAASIERFELAFVQDLLPAEPEPVIVPPPRVFRSAAKAAMPVVPAASAALPQAGDGPDQVAAAQTEPSQLRDRVLEPVPPAPDATDPTAPDRVAAPSTLPTPDGETSPAVMAGAGTPSEPAPPPSGSLVASSSAGKPFEWPLSTRLSYHLTGSYRGPVDGHARVEWLRQDTRYQVHLDVSIASVVSRRLSSEGTLGDEGLKPQRYEEVTQVIFSAPRQRSVRFEGDRVILANGRHEQALPQVQDTASQFVQLAWLFSNQSHRLKPGERIEVPLALPGRMDRWSYRVQAEDELELPMGIVRALQLKPERAQPLPGELSIETWFAPSLQYLPVRILIRQDAETFVDLRLSRLPQQVAAPQPAAR